MLDESELALIKIFQPHAVEKLLKAYQKQQRFVHYTTAATAMNILKGKSIWMRKSSCMNDYMEVQYGLECVCDSWRSDSGKRLQEFLEKYSSGIVEEITTLFDSWQYHMRFDTYVTCVSEHEDHEDKNGRLSMWRAYGGKSGVALIIKGAPFFKAKSTINVFSFPVVYLDRQDFQTRFDKVAYEITQASQVIKQLQSDEIVHCVFQMLYNAAIATKHPGFAEEKEWRIVYAPKIWQSNFVEKSTVAVNDEPQTIYKIPLKNKPELGVDWIEVNDILDQIIIGPTENADVVAEAFVDILSECNVLNPKDRITISDIPLR